MDPEVKAKWIAALRSGKYEQTRRYLRYNNGYCCLGVLCDLIKPRRWSRPLVGRPEWKYDGNYSRLRSELRKEIKLTLLSEKVLIKMNDAAASFAEIADYIQENL